VTAPQRRDHELSRIYSEGGWPEPSKRIDDAILEASRRSARARHPILHRWGPPVALAATVILGVSLALLVTDHESMRDASGLLRSDEPGPRAAPEKKREAPAAPAPRELFSSPMGPDTKPAPKAQAPAPLAKRAPPAAAAKAPPPAAAAAPVARPPDAWLDDIRKLKSQGRGADAERELAEFTRRYPDYPVPEDLR